MNDACLHRQLKLKEILISKQLLKQKFQTERSKMPKGTATYWKHDENQDDGDDVTMTIYEFLVDYVTDDLYILEIVRYVYPTCSYVLT